jgi:hypothetical protein
LRIRDDCDPATFNAALGPGACKGNGDTTLAKFRAELAEEGSVGAWRFNPDKEFTIDFGRTLTLESRAGETHTFTKVANFGGGFVAGLNAASGNPVPAPECAVVNADGTLSPQPASAANVFVLAGTTVSGPTARVVLFFLLGDLNSSVVYIPGCARLQEFDKCRPVSHNPTLCKIPFARVAYRKHGRSGVHPNTLAGLLRNWRIVSQPRILPFFPAFYVLAPRFYLDI